MDGTSVITALKNKLKIKTDKQLSEALGLSIPAIQLWKRRSTVTPLQVAGLVASTIKKTQSSATAKTEENAVKPIVEFFKLEKAASKGGNKFELFNTNGKDRPSLYLKGLRRELENHSGVYVFSDSRGHAIYVGKAKQQNLWKEMNLAFNRDRNDVQKIKRVSHPARNQAFKTNEEIRRQICPQSVALHEIALYFSAYKVADGMVNELEAMLVRSFANDLLNVRMEHFRRKK